MSFHHIIDNQIISEITEMGNLQQFRKSKNVYFTCSKIVITLNFF